MAASELPDSNLTALDRAKVDANVGRALQALAVGHFESGEECARTALDLEPRNARARAAFGVCLWQRARQGDPPTLILLNRADGETLHALKRAPKDPVVVRLRATFLAESGHPSAAAALAEQVLAGVSPTADPDVLALLAEVAHWRYELGEEAAAEPHLRALVVLQPKDAEAHYLLGRCMQTTAKTAADAGAAAREFALSAALEPKNLDCWLAVAGAWLGAAGFARQAGDEAARTQALQAALASLDAASKEIPAAALQHGRGVVLEALDRLDEAQKSYEAALQLDSAYIPALLNLAALHAAAAARDPLQKAAAERLLRQALALDGAGGTLTSDERTRIQQFLGPMSPAQEGHSGGRW
jgi:tetratricopeptide (TPR) repeat protein